MDPVHLDSLTDDTAVNQPARAGSASVMIWGLLGTISLLYLGLLVARPEVLSNYLPTVAPIGAPESNEGQRANAIAATQDLRDRVGHLEGEVKTLRDDLTAKTDSLSLKTVGLDDRLTAMETAKIAATASIPVKNSGKLSATQLSPVPLTQIAPSVTSAAKPSTAATSVDAVPTPPPAAPAPAAKKAAAPITATVKPPKAAAPVAAAAALPAANAAAAIAPPFEADTMPGVKLLNSIPPPSAPTPTVPPVDALAKPALPNSVPLTTGSVDPTAAATTPVARVAKPVGIYIGSGPSLEVVRSSWSKLSASNPNTLAGLQPRYRSSMDAEGMNYGLIAGPLKSTAEAQKVCQDLVAKSVNCRIGEYGGEAL